MESINERLASLPDLLGYDSPAALAKAAGLDPNTLRKAMQGPSKPSYDTLEALINRFPKLSSDWLLTGKGVSTQTAAQLPPPVPSEAKPQREGLPRTPGTATPQEADFVGRLIARLETELADSKAREAQQQQMIQTLLGKSPASPDAAALYATVDRMTVTGFQPTYAHQECKVFRLVA